MNNIKDLSFITNGPMMDRKAVRAARKEHGRGSLEVKAAKEDRRNERKERKENRQRGRRVKNHKATSEDVKVIKENNKTKRETPEFLAERAAWKKKKYGI